MSALASGTRLGPYEIIAPIGAGGMGEVYRAKDTRLGRDVAVKVLPQHLSAEPEIRARFEREAKTVSSLNHPNICTLFDVGRAPGEAGSGETDYLVMELIEGDTLAVRLQRGPLPAAELLRFGTQIADALDRAHRAGVVHRDLKPGNIMITRSGAKLMDFGLSRVTGMSGAASGSGRSLSALTQSPTMAQALTAEGTLLGTFQYMAPEQLEGKEADTRSDIWALGCVLYEMATGRRAFEGRSQASLIAAILERTPPPVGEAPSGTSAATTSDGPPPGIERLIRYCLAKDPEERIQTAHDVKLQLQGIAEGAGLSATSVAASQVSAQVAAARARSAGGTGARLAWLVAAVALLVAAGTVVWTVARPPAARQVARFRLSPIPGTADFFWPRVSPDGRFILLQGADSAGVVRAYVRPMDQVNAVPVPGTEGLRRAYWSPDGREIVFVAGDKIQRAPIGGGSPTVICAAQGGVDLSWGSRGHILMDGSFTDTLRVVSAAGGELRPATGVDREAGEVGSGWPCFLPDGEHFLFIGNLRNGAGSGNMRLGRLGSLESKLLGHSDGRVEYAPGGWVVFPRKGTLLAQKLDLAAGKLTGEPI
ncbi:MAG: protein kinase, partial [Candidatus Eisenbacteria bacterium]